MLLGNATLLYVAQICRLAVPILVLPMIARRLDLDQFAALGSAQALAYLIMIIPEYGFANHAPRTLAIVRDKPEALATETRRIMAAKLVLALPALAIGLFAGLVLPPLGGELALIFAMLALGLALGLSPSWFFQGVGEARRYAILEIVALLSFLTAVALVPFGPRDAALVLALQAAPFAAAALAGNLLALRRLGERTAEPLRILAALKDGFALFLTKLASNGPGLGLVYIIGFAVPPAAMAHYIAAERLLMGSANALWPVMQLLMPEIASRLERDPSGAARLLARGIGALVGIGLGLAVLLFGFAPWIIALLFGERFGPAVEALRIIALALPFMALTSALTGGVFVARKADWQLNALVIGAAALSAVLALTLIGPNDIALVPWIRLGVEMALALAMTLTAARLIRREHGS